MTRATYRVETSALILIDVLNDFLAPGGKLAESIGPMVEQTNLKPNLSRLLEGVRQAGMKVFYSPHSVNDHCFEHLPELLPRFQWALDNKVLWEGTWGADFYEPLRPRVGDVVIKPHHMFDSFAGTDLEQQLRANGVRHVVLAGLTSQTCVEGTGRHALEAGYHVTFLVDAVADFTERAHRAALEVSYPTFGHQTLTVAEFLSSIPSG